MRKIRFACVATAVLLTALTSSGENWIEILSDDFDGTTTNSWSYEGVSNVSGQVLFSYDATNGFVQCEWDQTRNYTGFVDPEIIKPSRLLRSLGRYLSDQDTFRIRATLNITTGAVPDTTEFHQIANVGLYNAALMGADRTMADDYSGNSNLIKDGSDFVEFNYFIGNNGTWGYYPSAEVTIGAHIDGVAGDYYFNYESLGDPMWHNNSMTNNWLPEGTNLYVEVIYYGASTNEAIHRRAYGALYINSSRTEPLYVNGIQMYYWTMHFPTNKSFSVNHAGFYNYVGANWGGPNAEGRGTYDDLAVDLHVPLGTIYSNRLDGTNFVLTFAAETGTTYYVEALADPADGDWNVVGTLQPNERSVSFTNDMNASFDWYRVRYEVAAPE